MPSSLLSVLNLLDSQYPNRDRFFTIIAHDLKSPLNAYQNLVDVLSFYLKKKEYSKLEQVSGLIDKNGAKLSILVDNLLNWGLAQDSKIILKPGLINIGEFILDLLPVYQLIANNKGVNLKHNFDENISVITDSNSLSIIIRNLLDNALKFSNPNSNVEIKVNKWENGIEIGVLNSFNPSTLHRVQEIKAFFTGNTNKTSGESEFGLGLVLIKRFARYNNIQISVTDTPAFELLFVLKLFTVK